MPSFPIEILEQIQRTLFKRSTHENGSSEPNKAYTQDIGSQDYRPSSIVTESSSRSSSKQSMESRSSSKSRNQEILPMVPEDSV
mmetsp:Transcript_95475/g.169515  ORF Transcript_95475/g.169515 Transcript_95475/m.169515 type:complete len:84 (+) Transcript_95475:45-296(+)